MSKEIEVNDKGKCVNCGANVNQYWYKITPGIVDILIILLNYVHEKNRNEFTIKEVRDRLSSIQYTQSTKLRFHALIAKVKDEDGKHTGKWLITSRAADFLRGDITIPARVLTYRNKVIDHEDTNVSVREVYGSYPYLEGKADFISPARYNPETKQQRLI